MCSSDLFPSHDNGVGNRVVGGIPVEIDTFGKGGLDLRRFDYGVAIGLSVEYRHYMIGVEGRLGLCKLQKELQGKNITGFVTAGYKF